MDISLLEIHKICVLASASALTATISSGSDKYLDQIQLFFKRYSFLRTRHFEPLIDVEDIAGEYPIAAEHLTKFTN